MRIFLSCLFGFSLLITGQDSTAAVRMGLLEAVKSHKASLVQVASLGGHSGKCLSLSVKNNTGEQMEIKVDPALIFVPEKKEYQHLVTVGEEMIVLNPGETKKQSLQAFCGKASASSPAGLVKYTYWKQGSPEMRLAAHYIMENSLFNYLGQHAIWMFTDGHCLSNVYDPGTNNQVVKSFVAYLAKITGQQVPEYFTWHRINAGRQQTSVYNVTMEKIYVDLRWTHQSRRQMHAVILDEHRNVYRTLGDGELINASGEHYLQVTFDPKKDPLGIYYVQLNDDENVIWQEKRVIMRHGYCGT